MRSHTDWLALLKSEMAGHEPKGSTARLVAEQTGAALVTGRDVAKLAEAVKIQPAEVRKLVDELRRVAEQVDAAVAALDKRQAEFEAHKKAELAKHEATVAKHEQEHASRLDRLTSKEGIMDEHMRRWIEISEGKAEPAELRARLDERVAAHKARWPA